MKYVPQPRNENIATYYTIKERFDNTKKPPRSKKYDENQRPLRRVQESHLMLQKDPHSYVVKINGAEVARYFEPDENGEHQIAVRGLYATYDINLMYRFTGLFSRLPLQTTEGNTVLLPLNHLYGSQGKDFSAVLTFNSSRQLIVEKSWHADVFKLVSTSEDKARRKAIKQQLEAYITLQMFKLPSLKDNAQVTQQQGVPFAEEELGWAKQNEMRDYLKELPTCLDRPEFATLFDEVSQDVFNMLASKRVFNVGSHLFWQARAHYGNTNPDVRDDAKERIQDIINSVTPDEHKKSLVARLMKYANLGMGSESVALPQFANELPRSYYLSKK